MPKKSSRRQPALRKSRGAFGAKPAVLAGLAFTVLVIVVLIAALGGRSSTGLPATITVNEAHDKYIQGALLVDVRTQAEWNDFHAPETILIPLDQLPQRLSELPRDREIVVVCRSGNRSQQGRDILLNAGFTRVTSMSGGLTEWREKGYPIEIGP